MYYMPPPDNDIHVKKFARSVDISYLFNYLQRTIYKGTHIYIYIHINRICLRQGSAPGP